MSLDLCRVTHQYSSRTPPVLRDVSFRFPPGRSIAIVGPSGSGKTTLLSIIGLLVTPSAGAVLVDDRPVERAHSSRLRAELFGWVFQTVNVLGRRSVEDNAMLGLLVQGADRQTARAAARSALARVGLARLAGHPARLLSGGELQRLCIARALAVQPRYLLADEPTGQLDRATSDGVMEALLAAGGPETTIIVVTHDMRVAARCDLVLSIRNGWLEIGIGT